VQDRDPDGGQIVGRSLSPVAELQEHRFRTQLRDAMASRSMTQDVASQSTPPGAATMD
jgi:hypothetical protein